MKNFLDKLFGKKDAAEPERVSEPAPPEAEKKSAMSREEIEAQAVGWNAIDAALKPIYGDQKPKHFGTILSYRLGGRDPLQGISAYQREHPVRHWHFVTYGFSELYEKESDNLTFSGWGFELTFRLRVDDFGDGPPPWAMNFLQNLARYVFKSGNTFKAGDHMNANGPIAAGQDTAIRAIAFLDDPELPPIDTPNGKLSFLQIVGLTDDEELALKQWNTLKALEVLSAGLPIYSTDLGRSSLMLRDEIRDRMREGAGTDGSSTGYLLVDQLAFETGVAEDGEPTVKIVMGARQVAQLLAILPYRLRFGNSYGLAGNNAHVWFKPGASCSFAVEDKELDLVITEQVQDALCASLKPVQGTYRFTDWPALAIEVRLTHIRDQEGEVVETIG